MHYLTYLILVNLQVSMAVSQESMTCCLPEKAEGERIFLESQKHIYFAIDYEINRIYITSDPKNDTYQIVDLGTRIAYNFKDGQCRDAMTFPGLLYYDRCLDGYTHVTHLPLGEAPSSVETSTFQIQESDVRRTALFTRRFDDSCLPLFIQDRDVRVGTVETSFIVRPSTTVSGYSAKRLRSNVAGCTYVIKQG